MKKQFLLPILLLVTFTLLKAQAGRSCGTDPRKIPFLKPQNDKTLRSDTSVLYIPVTANLVGNDAGTGHYAFVKLLDAMCKLNTDFQPYGFHFYLENLNYLNSSSFFNMHPDTFLFKEPMYQFIKNHNTPNTMNVYVVQEAGGYSFLSVEDWAGWDYTVYPPTWLLTQGEGIVLRAGHLNLNHLFTHEVGHYFGLYHTFNWVEDWAVFAASGTPDTAYYEVYDPDNDTTLTLPWLVSRVDGYNCELTGDLICDTPPDYLINGFVCNANQESPAEQKDPVGEKFRSDGTFYMSYSDDACQNRFSPQQVEVMKTVAEVTRNYLLYNQTPPDELTTANWTLTWPPENDSIPVSSDSITLQWDLPGAEYFFVTCRMSTPNGGQFTLLSGKQVSANEVKVKAFINRTYTWQVRGANRYFYCPDLFLSGQFHTVEATSAVRESGQPDRLTLTPNPVSSLLQIELPGALAGTMEVQVTDLQGRLIRSQTLSHAALLDVSGFLPGVYVLKVVAGERVYVGKFVKQ